MQRGEDRPRTPSGGTLRLGSFGIGGQAVHFRLIDQQVEGVQAAEHLVVGAVEVGLALALLRAAGRREPRLSCATR